MGLVRDVVSATCWLVLVVCFTTFTVITFLRPTTLIGKEALAKVANATTISFPSTYIKDPSLDTDEPLWMGDVGFWMSLQWGSVMMAAVAASILKYLKQCSHSRIYDFNAPWAAAQRGLGATLKRWARTALFYRLPPRKLLDHLCGGVTVLDALLVATWVGLSLAYVISSVNHLYKEVAEKYGDNPAEWALQRLEATGVATGHLLRFIVMVLFFPVSRSSFLKWVFGMTSQALIKYHRWMAIGCIIISFWHSTLWYTLWGAEGKLDAKLNFKTDQGVKDVLGTCSMIMMLLIAMTSTSWFRANYYKIFIPVHLTCFSLFILFAIIHARILVYWVLPALVVYGMDRAFRWWQLAWNWTCVSADDMHVDGNMITLVLRWRTSPGAVQPGQTVYLRVPALSLFYSHPFTVADVAEEEGGVTRVTLHIRRVGDWTKSLRQRLSERGTLRMPALSLLYSHPFTLTEVTKDGSTTQVTLNIRMTGDWTKALQHRLSQGDALSLQVEGPYESKMDYLQAAPAVVMIAGGTGVTPVLALCRRYARMALAGLPVPQVHLVWTSRSLAELRLMGSDLLAAATNTTATPASSLEGTPVSSPTHRRGLAPCVSTARGWLHAALHYTGLEHEEKPPAAAKHLVVNRLPGDDSAQPPSTPTSLDRIPSVKSTSQGAEKVVTIDIPCPSKAAAPCTPAVDKDLPLLSARPSGSPIVYAIAAVLAFGGAWGGFLAANYYTAYGFHQQEGGFYFVTVGALQLAAIALGACLPTLCVAAIHHAIVKQQPPATTIITPADLEAPQHKVQDTSYLTTSTTVLPGYVLAPAAPGSGVGSLQLARGRPKMAALLQRVREQYPHLQQVDVLVAGPDGLCSSVQDLCEQQAGAGPELRCRRVAYHT